MLRPWGEIYIEDSFEKRTQQVVGFSVLLIRHLAFLE